MSSIEMHSTFRSIFALFYEFGLWRNEEESEFRGNCWKFFHVLIHMFFQILIVSSAWLSNNRNDFIFYSVVEFGLVLLFIKLLFVLWKKKEILLFVHGSLFDISNLNREVKRKLNIFMKFVHGYLSAIAFAMIVVLMSPLPIFVTEKQFPFFINFPLDCRHNEIIYWMTYLAIAWGVILTVSANLMSVIIWSILLNNSIKYKLLGNQFKNLGKIRTAEIVMNNLEKEGRLYLQDFIALVKTHRNLCDYKMKFLSYMPVI